MARTPRWGVTPALDLPFIGAAAVALWAAVGGGAIPIPDPAIAASLYAGISALAGLVFAAATFACSMTYQNTSPLISRVRLLDGTTLRRNWISVLTWTLAAGLLPLAGMLWSSTSPKLALTASLAAVAVLLVKAGRALWWLQMTLFSESLPEHLDPYGAPPRLIDTRVDA